MKKYNFISRTLLLNETLKVADLYLELKDWNLVKEKVLADNILQKNKIVSQGKQFSEIKTRLELLSDEAIDLFVNSNLDTSKLILLFALAQKHLLLYEFIFEVLREKYLTFNYRVFDHDYDSFLRQKSIDYPEIEDWKDKTRINLKGYVFKILEEAGLIELQGNQKVIIKPFVPENVIKLIVEFKPKYLGIFLIPDLDIKNFKEKFTGETREYTE